MKFRLIAILLPISMSLNGQVLEDYSTLPVNDNDALPSQQVNCVFQDREGYVWFGTSEGLCRYDGYSVKVYKSSYLSPDLLGSNNVNCITQDNRQRVWIGTTKGLNVFDKLSGTIRPVNHPALKDVYVNTMIHIPGSGLWVGTETGLFLYSEGDEQWKIFRPDPSDPGSIATNRIRALCAGREGELWVGLWLEGLSRLDISTGVFEKYPPISRYNCVSAIHRDRDGTLWLGAWGEGVYRLDDPLDPASAVYHRLDSGSHYEKLIYSILRVDDTSLLVGTGLGVDIVVESSDRTLYHSSETESVTGIHNSGVKQLYCNDGEIIWVATRNNGVYMLFREERMFDNHELSNRELSLQSPSMNAFIQWGDDILIGTDNVGIVRFKKDGRMILAQDDPELSIIPSPIGNVLCFAKNPDGNEMYIGTQYQGLILCRLENGRIDSVVRDRYVPPSDWLLSNIVSSICHDNDGNVWIGTDKGINIITSARDSLAYGENRMGRTIDIGCITQDRKGRIWLGTHSDGILLADTSGGLDNLSFKSYNVAGGGIDIDNIECIYEDSRGRLWVGTNGGSLCMYDERSDRFEMVRGIDEFSGDIIRSIIEFGDFLWMGTYRGLLQYDPDRGPESGLVVFTEADGLIDNEFNRSAAMADGDGRLYFGTPHGFVRFDPGDLRIGMQKIPLVLTDIKLFHNSIDLLSASERQRLWGDTHPLYSRRITLSHRDDHFGIEFATLSYKHPEKNRYAYMLEGFDKGWNYVNSQNRSVYYTNMRSGHYRFKVRGSNENSYMRVEPEVLDIIVLPPLWLTWWAFMIYFLLLVFAAYRVVRGIRYRTRIRMEAFEHKKNEELSQEKIQLFTNISHELLTPLTVINCSVEELQRKYNDYGKSWNAIKGNIFRLNRLLEQILEFRKAEKGKLTLKLTHGDIGTFVTGLCEDYFVQYGIDRHISFEYQATPENIPAWFDSNAIDMIIYNLVSNAFKYNSGNGRVKLDVVAGSGADAGWVAITVGNTGHGFTEEQLSRLFGQFQYFSYAGHDKTGNGIGLSLVKSLTDLHGGGITVTSTPGVWTEFTVKIPIDRVPAEDVPARESEDISVAPLPEGNDGEYRENHEEDKDGGSGERHKNPTLLLIEDNRELLVSLTNLLNRDYNVLSTGRGDEGYRIATMENPDLIISDVLLPGIDGFALCERLKNELETSHIPVILLTAKIAVEDQRHGYRAGADAYITKPFDFGVMISQIESILLNRRLISERFREAPPSSEDIQTLSRMDQLFLEKGIAMVEANITNPDFDVDLFRTAMNLSKSTLYRKLKAITNLSPNEFIRNIRLKKSCELLKRGEHNISEIAYMVGFNDAKYFASCFKKEFNKTPSEYQSDPH